MTSAAVLQDAFAPVAVAAGAARAPSTRRSKQRGGRVGQRLAKVPSLYAVACMTCETIGPISTNPARGQHPPKKSGWRSLSIAEVSGWICRTCHRSYRRLLPPPTRGDCKDGPRPCPHTICRYHLVDDISRKAKEDFELSETCALDVADKGEHTLREIGQVLGMTREGSRYVILCAVTKLQTIPGLDFDFEDDVDGDSRELP